MMLSVMILSLTTPSTPQSACNNAQRYSKNDCFVLQFSYECQYAECRYAECRYAECRFYECFGLHYFF
jgi:hypothetical protein